MSKETENLIKLGKIAKRLIENNKGILAADESPSSIGKKFDLYDIENTEENRRKFREILFTTDGYEKYIGGVILHEETFEMNDSQGNSFIDILSKKSICIGIKLDKGLQTFEEDERISVGLEDLENRIQNKIFEKAVFAKWRSLFIASNSLPSQGCIDENCKILAKYAKICQKYGKVPIVEPELYFKGNYQIEDAKLHTKQILSHLMRYLNDAEVYIPGVIIKMSFVTEGDESIKKHNANEIGIATLECLISTVPCGIPGIVFLSGGHIEEDAIDYLAAVNKLQAYKTWDTSFSYGRTLTDRPMEIWKGNDKNIKESQKALYKLTEKCYQSNKGE